MRRARRLAQEVKNKHEAVHNSAKVRHKWVMAAHKTQASKLAEVVTKIMTLNGKSAALQAKADADRELGRELMAGAFKGMGMSPSGTGWAEGQLLPTGQQMPMESSGAEGVWGDRPFRPKNVVLDLDDARQAGMLPPWYVDGFKAEDPKARASITSSALQLENV